MNPSRRGVRNPGGLVSVSVLAERAREVLGTLNKRENEKLRPVIEAFLAFAQAQDAINKRFQDGVNSLPVGHNLTHQGGDDSIEGRETPAIITPDDAGTIGSPQRGYAPINHRHPITTDPPVAVGMGNVEGSANTFARSDHQHDGVPWLAGVKPHVHLATDIPNFAAAASDAASSSANDANTILAARIFGG